jgi:BirA family biotin operon repressor/biotin-[acetyl-CoA-carboxylase] ligase
LTTYPDHFHPIHLDRCASTNEYIKQNLARLEDDFPLVVSASAQSSGRGRDGRSWFSAPARGIYVTFAFSLGDSSGLPLLSIAAGIAVADMLQRWTHREFALKWPNDILAAGKKIAGILCESMIASDKVTCLVGIGINANQQDGDFPMELRARAGSLRQLTGAEWPLAEGRERLAASMALWLRRLGSDRAAVLEQARCLSRPFLKQEIEFHHQGQIVRGLFCGLAEDGGLLLETADKEKKVYYSGEIIV